MPKQAKSKEIERAPEAPPPPPAAHRRERAANWLVNGLFAVGVLVLFGAFFASTTFDGSKRVLWTRVLAGAAAFLFVGGLAVGWREVVTWIKGRATQEGLIRLGYIVGMWALIGFAVYLGMRYNIKKDLTAERAFTLSEKTIETAKGLAQPVEIISCMKKGGQSDQKIEDLLSLYEDLHGNVTVTRLNPDKHIDKMIDMGLESKPDVVVVRRKGASVRSGNTQTLSSFDVSEQKITSAILAVSRSEKKKVYFLEGHGELSIDEAGKDGATQFKGLLEEDQYEVASLNLMTESAVPADAAAIVIARARTPLLEQEATTLKSWLDQGGSLLILATSKVIAKDAPDFATLLEGSGITIMPDLVVDPGAQIDSALPGLWFQVSGKRLEKHVITQAMRGYTVFFDADTCSLRVEQAPPQQPGMPPEQNESSPIVLAKSSDLAFAQSAPEGETKQIRTTKSPSDTPGPLTLAACVEKPVGPAPMLPDTESKASEKKMRIVVFGDGNLACDADLLEDQGVALQSGGKLRTAGTLLARDAVHWLTDAADLIAIPPKDAKDPQITIERKQTQWNRFFVLLGPILPLAAGLWVWYVRRG